jgi:hypothetical protein
VAVIDGARHKEQRSDRRGLKGDEKEKSREAGRSWLLVEAL